jgi:hypothetical protein
MEKAEDTLAHHLQKVDHSLRLIDGRRENLSAGLNELVA